MEKFFGVDKLSKKLEQIDPYYVNRLMTKGVIVDNNCKHFGELKKCFLLCHEVLLYASSGITLRFLLRLFFGDPVACHAAIIFQTFAEELNETFWTKEDELFLKILGKI